MELRKCAASLKTEKKSEEVVVSHQSVPERGADLWEGLVASGEVRETSGEVWETSREVAEKLLGKFGEILGSCDS